MSSDQMLLTLGALGGIGFLYWLQQAVAPKPQKIPIKAKSKKQ